ncbi:MFS transporter [Nesterenkonia sp. CL21]|uniref:MFS transporter n=1 Tax=Nesterenkonia sp. CL21 TaxID=3064894 RepID=UPI002878FCE3|nr:MFS transporter [Nesterenkonia sp. CL21]MDS2174160.1 MFS transporter [Nesterenkonia sp. CL21]
MAHTTTAEQTSDDGVSHGATSGTEPLGRRFQAHLGSVALANLADGVLMTGIPLIAVSLTRSPQEISLLSALFWLPWLLFGLFAGVVIDRSDRRRVRIVALSLRVVVLVGLIAVALAGALRIEVLILFMGLYGLTQVFADLAGRTMVPQVAPRSRLAAANGRTMAAEQVFNDFIGRPVAGLLVVLGAGWLLGFSAAVCAAAVLLITLGLRGDYRAGRTGQPRATAVTRAAEEPRAAEELKQPAEGERSPSDAGLSAVFEGLRLVWRHPVLRPLVIMSCAANLASTAFMSVFVLWAVGQGSAIGLTEAQYPFFAVASAVGAVSASFLVERMTRRAPEVPLMLGSFLAQVPIMLLPVLFPRFDVLLLAGLLQGFLNMTGNVIAFTLFQRLVSGEVLGRMTGAITTVGFGLMPLGAVLGGFIGEHFGLPTVFVAAAALLGAAVVWSMTQVRQSMVEAAEQRMRHAEDGGDADGDGDTGADGSGHDGGDGRGDGPGVSPKADAQAPQGRGRRTSRRTSRRTAGRTAGHTAGRRDRLRAEAERDARRHDLGGGVEFRWA